MMSIQVKANLIMFIALLYWRSPKSLQVFKNLNPTKNRDQVLFKTLTGLCNGDLQQLFGRMQWLLLCAPADKHFLTSDDPACCWQSDKNELTGFDGLENKNTEITFPLSRKVCAFANWKSPNGKHSIPILSDEVDAINSRTIHNAYRFVYGPINDTGILSLIKQRPTLDRLYINAPKSLPAI